MTRFHYSRPYIPLSILIVILFSGTILAQGPEISFEPRHFLDPTHTAPDEELAVTLKISNTGDATLNISDISLADVGDGTGWINMGTYASSVDPGQFTDVSITLNYNTVLSGIDPAGYDALIIISHNAPTAVDTVAIHLTAASDFDMPQQDVLNTTCKQLMVYNTGRLGGGNDGYSLNIPDDCDSVDIPPNALMYLNHASPLIAWNDGSENLAYTTLFSQDFTEEGTFRPQSELHFYEDIEDPAGNYDMIACTVSTSDSLYGVAIHLFAPTDGVNCFVLGRYKFFNWNPLKNADEVYLGLIADWNIPSDNAVDNGSGFNETMQTMWQFGAEYDTLEQDNIANCVAPIVESDRLGGIAVLYGNLVNAWTGPNQLHLLGSGFDKEYLLNTMSTLSGYVPYDQPLDTGVDLHTGMTFEVADMTDPSSYSYIVAFVTGNQGEPEYLAQIAATHDWAINHELMVQYGACQPGDANWDYEINVADAVFLISYIFKGGPPPTNAQGGDANGDCASNVGDAVYIISYVFKGGPPPLAYSDWIFQCWY